MKHSNPKPPTATPAGPARPGFQKRTGPVSLSTIIAIGAFNREARASFSASASSSACTGSPPASVEFDPVVLPIPMPAYPGGGTGWLTLPTFTYGAFCDAERGVWTCRITKAFGTIDQVIGSPLQPLTSKLVHDTVDCATLRKMYADLIRQASSTEVVGYLPQECIQLHEDVHRDIALASAKRHYTTLVAEIEAIALPCGEYPDADAAFKAMHDSIQRSGDYYFLRWATDWAANVAHQPPTPFFDAAEALLDRWSDAVPAQAEAKGCNTIGWP